MQSLERCELITWDLLWVHSSVEGPLIVCMEGGGRLSRRCMGSLFAAQEKDDNFLHFLWSAYLPFFYLPRPLTVLRENLVPLVATHMAGQTPPLPITLYLLFQNCCTSSLTDWALPSLPWLLCCHQIQCHFPCSATSSAVQSIRSQVHRWMDTPGFLVCCAEVLSFFNFFSSSGNVCLISFKSKWRKGNNLCCHDAAITFSKPFKSKIHSHTHTHTHIYDIVCTLKLIEVRNNLIVKKILWKVKFHIVKGKYHVRSKDLENMKVEKGFF